MWPKALSQLLDLLPHIARLLPAADNFLQTKASGDESTRRALDQMAADLRSELKRVTQPREELHEQLSEQRELLTQLAEQTQAARAAAEAAEARAAGLERRVAVNNALLAIVLPLLVVLVILTILLVVRH